MEIGNKEIGKWKKEIKLILDIMADWNWIYELKIEIGNKNWKLELGIENRKWYWKLDN